MVPKINGKIRAGMVPMVFDEFQSASGAAGLMPKRRTRTFSNEGT